jgi:hypothetical protein
MNRALIMFVAILALAASPGLPAQSGPEVAGNGADVPFPSQMVVVQSPTELSVKRSSVRQSAFAAVYKLDGTRVTVEAPTDIKETGEAKFDGANLVVTSRRLFSSPAGDTVVDFMEIWSLSGNALTVKKTMTQEGESQTATAVYEKSA